MNVSSSNADKMRDTDVFDALMNRAKLAGSDVHVRLHSIKADGSPVFEILPEHPVLHGRLVRRDELDQPSISADRMQTIEAIYLARVVAEEGLQNVARMASHHARLDASISSTWNLSDQLTEWAQDQINHLMLDPADCHNVDAAAFAIDFADEQATLLAEVQESGEVERRWIERGELPHVVLARNEQGAWSAQFSWSSASSMQPDAHNHGLLSIPMLMPSDLNSMAREQSSQASVVAPT